MRAYRGRSRKYPLILCFSDTLYFVIGVHYLLHCIPLLNNLFSSCVARQISYLCDEVFFYATRKLLVVSSVLNASKQDTGERGPSRGHGTSCKHSPNTSRRKSCLLLTHRADTFAICCHGDTTWSQLHAALSQPDWLGAFGSVLV
jgi:hypothetical protein